MDTTHPLVTTLLLPLLSALLATGLVRWGLGERVGARLAASGVGIALLLATMTILGDLVWPPRTGPQKLPFLFALLLTTGVILDVVQPARRTALAAGAVALGLSILWLGWPWVIRGDLHAMIALAAAVLIGLAVLLALHRARSEGVNGPTMLLVAALGLGGAALSAGSLALFQVALAIAAALAGFAAWSWPKPRMAFTASGWVSATIGALSVAVLVQLLTDIRPVALLPLAMVFLGDAVARRLPMPAGLVRTTGEPLYIVVLGILPVLAAVWLAQSPSDADPLYYR